MGSRGSVHGIFLFSFLYLTRKYLLRGLILGVLTHTTAWDHHLEGDETRFELF